MSETTESEPATPSPALREIVERLRDADRLIHTGVTPSGKFVRVHLESTEVCALMPLFAEAAAALLAADERAREAERERDEARRLLNAPELHDFARGVALEAAHQRGRWGADHDAGKAPEDWFWLLGYLGGKALHAAKAGDHEKALHHCVSTAAALANWHAALLGMDTTMRPGIDPEERGYES